MKKLNVLKVLSIIASIIVIIFALLGITKVLDYDISMPIMMFSLGLVNLLNFFILKNKSKQSAYFGLITAIFIFIVFIFVVFVH